MIKIPKSNKVKFYFFDVASIGLNHSLNLPIGWDAKFPYIAGPSKYQNRYYLKKWVLQAQFLSYTPQNFRIILTPELNWLWNFEVCSSKIKPATPISVSGNCSNTYIYLLDTEIL